MLILTRKRGEKIFIGDDIEILVLDVWGDTYAKLGITAPGNVSVHREEVYKRIKSEGEKNVINK